MFPLPLTFWIAKVSLIVIKRLGRGGGTAFPGLMAERLNQKLLSALASQLKGTIVISGTNGKTTTARLIASFIEGSGASVVHNRSGSNLTRGLMSTLIARADWKMKIDADWGIFETDEAVFAKVVDLLQPQYVIALNIFRDQLDRYGEVDTLAAKWRTAIERVSPKTTLIFNADDPLVSSLSLHTSAQLVPYGMMPDYANQTTLPSYADSRRCPVCGRPLVFSRVAYSHLGHYRCPTGDFSRPEPQVFAENIKLNGMSVSQFKVHLGATTMPFELGLAGVYNIYNATAAITLAWCLNVDMAMVQERTANFESVFGRLEEVKVGNTKLTLILVKNPTGFNQVIQTLQTEKTADSFWLVLNDKFADGRDVSWIWDVEIEKLVPQAKHIICSGTRAYDMALRTKYANVDPSTMIIVPSLAEGLRTISGRKDSQIYCLCTYTSMLTLRQLLQKRRAVGSYHQQ